MPEQKREGKRGEESTSFLHMSNIVTLSPSFKINILIRPVSRIETQAGHSPKRFCLHVCTCILTWLASCTQKLLCV